MPVEELKEEDEEENLSPNHMNEDDLKLEDMLDNGRFRSKFKGIQQIGEGGFGKVYKAIYKIDQKVYAIKVVRLHFAKNGNDSAKAIFKNKVYREI